MKTRIVLFCAVPFAASPAAAQVAASDAPVSGEPIVVTATRVERPASEVPASIDSIGADRIRAGQLQVNLSETLPTIPGVVANNRQNYAQDLQISVRGFGARSTFGVRGVRIIVDGIPATLPDGQGQVSHIDLSSAGRIEVLRGPFSVLHGNASGGVINVFTALPDESSVRLGGAAGSYHTHRAGVTVNAVSDAIASVISAARFQTQGYRDHSAAERTNGNALVRWDASSATSVTFVANALDMPQTQDPLGLTRAQLERDPRSVDPTAIQFNTRKSVDQAQAGLVLEHAFSDALSARATAYGGRRNTEQFQAIPVAAQGSPLHPGGVIDLARDYNGIDVRASWQRRGFTVVAGANVDQLDEDRKGFLNFVGSQLGVQGALRRNESNRVTETGQYVQAEWTPLERLSVLAGVRASRVTFKSDDHFVTASNPDDSGRLRFTATTPVAGVTWRMAERLHLYAAAGRGFETPTANELAYRSSGGTGLNTGLKAAKSDSYEVGAKWQYGQGWRATAALFRVNTSDEIVVETNVGGRSTFRNAGRTRREGVELLADRDWGPAGLTVSFTQLKATYEDGFVTCVVTPCAVPNVVVAAGNRIPGIPYRTAYAEARVRPLAGLEAALEARYSDKLYVNDVNNDAAAAYTVASARVTYTWRQGKLVARPFLRVDNLFDRRYVGSVIVNEGNSRFFEPAPGRTVLAGISLQHLF
ncbi:MAG TPA: TonB-dependent receptor [Usitatibacter sp.]|nr:TonB-dependent receptor [Usitatibacter sp.]